MKVWFKKTLNGLQPATRTDEENLQACKFKLNEYYEGEFKKPRNSKFHRKFFALLNIAYENQNQFNNIDEFRAYVTMKSGFFKRVLTGDGEFIMPKSISFSKMDQTEFDFFYDQVFSFILTFLKCDDDDLLEQLKDF